MAAKICLFIAAVMVFALSFAAFFKTGESFAAAQKGTVVNCRYRVNVRSGPGTSYKIIGKAPKGAVYDVAGKKANGIR